VFVFYDKQKQTSARLEATILQLQTVIHQQEVLRSQVLCPMYKIFLGSYAPSTRNPGPDRDKYEATFNDMRIQFQSLQCAGELVPPRSDLPVPR
jgi:hypothetical protein